MTLSELQKCRPSASNPWWDANFGGTCDHRRDVPGGHSANSYWNTSQWSIQGFSGIQKCGSHLTEIQLKGPLEGQKRPLLFSCFTWVFESPVWNLGIPTWTHQLDQIRTIPWKIHEKSLKSVTHHHSLYGSFLCPCWNSNFEPLVSIHVKS